MLLAEWGRGVVRVRLDLPDYVIPCTCFFCICLITVYWLWRSNVLLWFPYPFFFFLLPPGAVVISSEKPWETVEPFALSSIYVIWGRKSFTAETGHFLDTSRKVFISCRAREVVVAGQELLLFICVLHFRFHRVITCLKDCLERSDSFLWCLCEPSIVVSKLASSDWLSLFASF